MGPLLIALLAASVSSVTAASAPVPFLLVNGAGADLDQITIRPADGTSPWRPLGGGRLPVGGREAIAAQPGRLCAFDIRARAGGSVSLWPSVNLCDVKVVTLHRRPDGTLWVDYD